jgi:N-acyl-D-amino-acid deacylase
MLKDILYYLCYGLISLAGINCSNTPKYDLLITNARIVDGTGDPGYLGSILIQDDTIVAVGREIMAKSKQIIDAEGHVLCPGFINMLSWATESLLHDGRAMSDLKQGVTLEVMGEGWSMGPLNDTMAEEMLSTQGDIKFEIKWRTLGEYLSHLEEKGVSPNVASFVGATTVRIHELSYENRPPSTAEMEEMKKLVVHAMEEGAVGLATSLIYAPGFYADTDELIELSKAIAPYDGLYITHMRSEGNQLLEGVAEAVEIAEEAGVRAEIYHLKAGGQNNWTKMDEVISVLEEVQEEGIDIAANMYTYIAGATGLDASMPPWVQEGGFEAWVTRLKDPEVRKRVKSEMKSDANDWENLYYSAGSTDNVLLVEFKNDTLKKYTGMSLTEVSKLRGTDPEDTMINLVIQDGSRVGTVYFLMSEENVKKQIQLPYVSFGSDASAPAAEGVFLQSNPHPRAYGNFARLLGKYVREEGVISLEEAIRKLTLLSALKLRISKRGLLAPGFFADLVIFDPKTIIDKATFAEPHQYAEGVKHVFVNGKQVIRDGEHTGATPGRFVKGPGWRE